jgi:hypothetical protein
MLDSFARDNPVRPDIVKRVDVFLKRKAGKGASMPALSHQTDQRGHAGSELSLNVGTPNMSPLDAGSEQSLNVGTPSMHALDAGRLSLN